MNRWTRLALVVVLAAIPLGVAWLMHELLAASSGEPMAAPAVVDPHQAPANTIHILPQAPRAALDAGAPVTGVSLAKFSWGSGSGDLGRHRPQEGNPEAPMSLAVDARGNTLVLDQVNTRLVTLDTKGSPLSTTPITLQAAQDVAVAADGTVLVTDRLVDKSVALMRDGKLVGELPLVGKGLPEGGAATGVFTDGKSVYVEREHGDLVRIGTTDGTRDTERPEIPGRPTRDAQSYVSANIADAKLGTVVVTSIARPALAHRFSRVIPMEAPIVHLVLLDSDLRGTLYLGALVQTGITVRCLDPLDGHPIGTARFPANEGADETFRELSVSNEGVISYLHRTESGAELLQARCQAP